MENLLGTVTVLEKALTLKLIDLDQAKTIFKRSLEANKIFLGESKEVK